MNRRDLIIQNVVRNFGFGAMIRRGRGMGLVKDQKQINENTISKMNSEQKFAVWPNAAVARALRRAIKSIGNSQCSANFVPFFPWPIFQLASKLRTSRSLLSNLQHRKHRRYAFDLRRTALIAQCILPFSNLLLSSVRFVCVFALSSPFRSLPLRFCHGLTLIHHNFNHSIFIYICISNERLDSKWEHEYFSFNLYLSIRE